MNDIEITVTITDRMFSEMGPIFDDACTVPDDYHDSYLVRMRDLGEAIGDGRRVARGRVVTLRGRYLIETMRDEADYRRVSCAELAEWEGVGMRAVSTAFRNLKVRCDLALEGQK